MPPFDSRSVRKKEEEGPHGSNMLPVAPEARGTNFAGQSSGT